MNNVLILGGTGSIGESIVRELEQDNNHIVIISLNNKKNNSNNKTYYNFDLNKIKDLDKILKIIKTNHGFIEKFVNCAGNINRKNFLTESYLEFTNILNINFIAPMLIMKKLLKEMRLKKKGNFINFSSQVSKVPHPNAGPSYEISKSSLVTLSRHIAFNYAKFNIRSNIISPGTIKSQMQSTINKTVLSKIKKNIPLKRLGKPIEAAKLVKFLLSDESSYVTGVDIKIAGGSILD